MRMAVGFLFVCLPGIAALAQAPTGPLDVPVEVRTLTIVSNDVSQELRQNIVLAYQGQTYPIDELEERIRQGLRDLGFANARVEIPRLASMPAPSRGQSVDVTVQISTGAIYFLSEIRFEHASFRPEQLRTGFPIADGSVFNATAIGKGLDNLKDAYQSIGFINFGAIPKLQYDEALHTVALTIDIDEGRQYLFGHLLLDGVEPHTGAVQALETAWKPLEGAGYNPHVLAKWLGSNATFIPNAETAPKKYVSVLIDDDGSRVNVQLEFPSSLD